MYVDIVISNIFYLNKHFFFFFSFLFMFLMFCVILSICHYVLVFFLIVGNYRPISVSPIFSKIFEKVVYKQLYTYFEQNNILYEHQCGFRKHKSTVQALLNHMQFMYGSTDSCNFLYQHVFFRLEATVRF